jgi:hypothetical protein
MSNNKTPIKRGKYKKYLWDSTQKIPKSTVSDQRKKLKASDINEHQVPVRQNETPAYSSDPNFEISYEDETTTYNLDTNLDILNDDEQTSQNHSNVLNEDNEISLLNENNETSRTEECMSDFIEAISSDDVTQTELVTAYIAAFFNGRTTQTSLSDFIKLSNITSQVKLPTSFDGLKNIVVGKNNSLVYSKTWFCNVCIKPITSLNHRLDRHCPICKTK